MKEILRTNDLVLISLVEAILQQGGVRFFVADSHMSALEGSTGFLQRRVLVDETQFLEAQALLAEAGLEHELRDAP